MMEKEKDKKSHKSRRSQAKPKPMTPERLEKAALHYLERYSTSADNLRRVLLRRIGKSAILHNTDPDEGAGWVDALIARYQRAGLLDDVRYAETRAASLHRQGKSIRAIRQALNVKGVEETAVSKALVALEEEVHGSEPSMDGPSTDLLAAIHYARRRRIGPWRRKDRSEKRDRDLAALGRQGFGYDVARRIVEAEDVECLEALL